MTVHRLLKLLVLAVASLLPLCARPARAAKPPTPLLNIALEDLGYQPVPNRYLLLGDSVLSVHFVDDTHLLVTFTTRGLLTRLPDAQDTDQDQNVAALLLELPTGKVLARTVWRERDRGRYLWAVGHGRFILRVRSKLTLLDPLANLAGGKAFQEESFVELHRTVGYITVSPTGDLVAIETIPNPQPKPAVTPASSTNSSGLRTRTSSPEDSEVQINFFRLVYDTPPGHSEHLTIQSAGIVRSRNLIEIPATSEGYLDVSQESPGVFLFDFQAHGGKRLELAPFDTSCAPTPHFISPSEFIAFGCRGSEDKQQMAGFNLHGEEPWVDAFPNRHYFPSVAAAPAAGRFALSRTILTGTYIDADNLIADQIAGQEITVMQSWDGRILFKLNATPFQRSGQNFDLSPSGQTLAIIHDGRVQTYALAPLTRKDADALKLAATYVPPPTQARISLGGRPTHASGPPEEKTADESVGARPSVAADPVPSQTIQKTQTQAARAEEPNAPVNGDPDPTRRRPPPTLYTPEYPRQKGDPKPSAESTPKL